VVVLLLGRTLWVANLGDSRAVVCRGGAPCALTRDQTADRGDERARVAAAGAAIARHADAWRVGGPGLAVTRSVGDADLKAVGVCAEAEVEEVAVGPGDSFLVIGSDGVWEWVGEQAAVALVHDTVKQPAMCARRLVTEALACGSRDNATAVVAFLGGEGAAGTAERVYHGGRLKYGGGGGAGAGTRGGVAEDEMRDTY
jgi:serine/threonine protein phosphatase PrpC